MKYKFVENIVESCRKRKIFWRGFKKNPPCSGKIKVYRGASFWNQVYRIIHTDSVTAITKNPPKGGHPKKEKEREMTYVIRQQAGYFLCFYSNTAG